MCILSKSLFPWVIFLLHVKWWKDRYLPFFFQFISKGLLKNFKEKSHNIQIHIAFYKKRFMRGLYLYLTMVLSNYSSFFALLRESIVLISISFFLCSIIHICDNRGSEPRLIYSLFIICRLC